MTRVRSTLALLLVLALAACGGETRRGGGEPTPPPADAAVDVGTTPSPPPAPPPPPAADRDEDALVYAHSSTTLYALDPRTLDVTAVGDFADADGAVLRDMTDLAVRSDGVIFTCSFDTLFVVDPATAVARAVGDFDLPEGVRFNALSFVPPGSLDAAELLIGATAEGEIHRVDPSTAATSLVATMSDGFGSSGDVVGIEGLGVFATVSRADRSDDLLVRLDPATGAVTPVGDGTGTSRIFGLGFFRDQLFGFTSLGWIYTIDPLTGVARSVESSAARSFWGAGVTPRVVVDLI